MRAATSDDEDLQVALTLWHSEAHGQIGLSIQTGASSEHISTRPSSPQSSINAAAAELVLAVTLSRLGSRI